MQVVTQVQAVTQVQLLEAEEAAEVVRLVLRVRTDAVGQGPEAQQQAAREALAAFAHGDPPRMGELREPEHDGEQAHEVHEELGPSDTRGLRHLVVGDVVALFL